MINVLEGLNPEQKEAVTHREGPLLIIAGAGTGKTTVITHRIAWLLSEGLAKTNEILALTFTDKASLQMLERVDVLVPYGYTDIWIMTFHAFGDRILRENALEVGLNPDFQVLTRAEAMVFFREHLFEFALNYYRPLSEPTRFIEALISVFSRAKDEDVSPQQYYQYAQQLMLKAKETSDEALLEEALKQMEIASAYNKYQELLAKHGLIDFGNQFYLALKLLREHPFILKRYQKQFKFILVDEFQDTNFAQFQMVKLLAEEHKNITVVADDDQSIYRWRGAAYSNVLNFMEAFPESKKISLIRNYRSNQMILDSAYQLIQYNNPERFEVKSGINKKLIALSEKGLPPIHKHFDNHSSEADWVAGTIKNKVKTKKYKFGDFAILVRSNSDAQGFLQAMNMQGIPWQFSGAQGLYSKDEVKLCIHFLKFMADPLNSLSLYYLLNSQIYNIDHFDLSLCMHYAKIRNKPLYSVFKNLDKIPELSEVSQVSRKKIDKILFELERFFEISRQQTTGRLLYKFLTETGFLKRLTKKINLENEVKIQNIAKFFNIVRDFEFLAKEDRVINFVNHLDLLIEAGDDPETQDLELGNDVVNVLTIHKAKGLEFRVVFLVNLVNGKFPVPHRRQPIELPDALIKEILPSGDFHIQEERRLFYVGMTRAKEELYFTSAVDYGGVRLRQVSQFVIEALGKARIEKESQKIAPLETIKHFAPVKILKTKILKQISWDEILNLSYYQIDDYITCPLKYMYVHILHVPIMEHHTVIYGKAMHEAVTKYFQYKLMGKEMELSELLDIFKQNFIPQGFIDEEHQQERFRVGQQTLVRFFNEEKKRNSQPLYVEKEFSFLFENNRITGRFDRIDIKEDGAIIMDFKTSELNKQKEADKRAKESLQLLIYAFAYKSIFGKLPKLVQLYFLESGLIGSYQVKDQDLEKVKKIIREVSEGIRKANFSATPSYISCTYCAYNQICSFRLLR
ncbi:MAG: ATP-dependent helicase [Candidatus Omnitrophica bacterium]|nr:ATP-dependent helicase [Candidatus Omnitrophota bacterium]